ncbi:MAG: UDP-3-O-(3-hydroxymyristoyl)glucosamine N-acyltransferase [bacterium]
MRVAALASRLAVRLEGAGETEIVRVAPLTAAGPGCLAGLFEPRYRADAAQTRAAVVLTTEALAACLPPDVPRLVADDARAAWGLALRLLHPRPAVAPPPVGIDPRAAVDPAAQVAASARIGPFVTVEPGALVGDDSALFSGAYVGAGAEIGPRATLHPGATVLDACLIGSDVFIGSRAVIGSPGFGLDDQGRVPHVGRVVIGEGATIGALSSVDRGTVGDTLIGAGAHLDNQVQVGHNARVGPGAVLCGQVGLAGGAVVEAGAVLGGQAGVAGRATVGARARVAAQSGVTRNLAPDGTYSGHPAEENGARLRRLARLKRLADR